MPASGRIPFPPGEVLQLLSRVVPFHHRVADVGPVEAGTKTRLRPGPGGRGFAAGGGVGGGGEGDAGYRRVALVQGRKLQVFRAEVVAPLRNAMGFVDGEQGQLAGFVEGVEERQAALVQQALGAM